MLHISTLPLQESCLLSVKHLLGFCAKLSWIEDKSVRFVEEYADFSVLNTNYLNIQHPTVGSQKLNTLQVEW